ncbi:putative nuclease HARBI1 [Aphis gossypii]|uniref:putative nuclease HARBI1 n=1 Tax=Aphis gossypii TaxID=80765 RepID=UPI002158F3BC|nr:putative nuclease HARBI1 [Aphis gossypii]
MGNLNEQELVGLALILVGEVIFFSSSEENEEDDHDFELAAPFLTVNNVIPRMENYVEKIVPQFNDGQFKSHFRMLPKTFEFVLNIIVPKLVRKKPGCPTIKPNKQFLIAIWKMVTPDSYRSICEKFNVGRATALKYVRRVVNALDILAPAFIVWPNEERAKVIRNGFFATSNFPNVLGAIDGTHINIPAPHDHPESYVNRKGHHSIQLQTVCDHQCKFINCYAGNVGSVHDQRVFHLSELHENINNPTKFPNNSHLVGDAAYTLQEHLLVPYRDDGHLTEKQKNYNFCHSSSRMAIERSFGSLKGRFRSLLTTLAMERVDLIPKFIIACCLLHNICLLKNYDIANTVEVLPEAVHDRDPVGRTVAINRLAVFKRYNICERLPIRNV